MAANIKGFFYRSLFFLGWILSPLTFWNDAFINIPLAYLCASLVFGLAHYNFIFLVVAFYWLSNILGLVLMYASGKGIAKGEGITARVVLKTILTILIYSIVLVVIHNLGVLKPIRIPVK